MNKFFKYLAVWRLFKKLKPTRRKSRLDQAKRFWPLGALAGITAAAFKLKGRKDNKWVDGSSARGDQSMAEDATTKERVESTIFRDAEAPKGSVNVDVAYGVVTLRGTATTEWSERLEREASELEGVSRVENLIKTSDPVKM